MKCRVLQKFPITKSVGLSTSGFSVVARTAVKLSTKLNLPLISHPPKPAQPKAPSAASKPVPKPGTATKMLNDLQKAANAFSRFKAWLDTPDPPKPTKEARDSQTKADTVAPFDIQEIPITMRALSLPMGAKLMERWFAGQLRRTIKPKAGV